MRRTTIILLQSFTIIIGLLVLTALIRLPLSEGRAAHLDLFHIYADPFILYGYLASVPFFIGLYQGFKILGYTKQHKLFSFNSISALKILKYCAVIFGILIIGAGLFIILFHSKEDDPAGFIALCILTIISSMVVASIAATFEKKLLKNLEINK
ncbi:MAG: DUF2975 domain-containing protein [Bacteroidetes bacterium]|nr:DUF2975 domain-containing protein [Bacteroidota bacterium]